MKILFSHVSSFRPSISNYFLLISFFSIILFFLTLFGFYSFSRPILFFSLFFFLVWSLKREGRFRFNSDDVIFLFFSIVIFIVSQYVFLHEWDEFSHWATAIKYLKIHLFLPQDSLIDLCASYIPGMTLWISILSDTDIKNEHSLYFANFMFSLLFFYFVLNGVLNQSTNLLKESGGRRLLFLSASFCFYFFWSDKIFPFFSIYVDNHLATFFVGALVSLRIRDKKESFFMLLGSLILLTLSKHTGFLFSGLAIIMWLASRLFKKDTLLSVFRFGAISIFLICFLKLSWDYYVSTTKINIILSQKQLITSLFQFHVDLNDRLFQIILPSMFKRAIGSNLFLTFILILIVFEVLYLKFYRKLIFNFELVFYFLFSTVTYFIFLALSYRFIFGEYEGSNLSSFDRYFGTIIVSWAVFVSIEFLLFLDDQFSIVQWRPYAYYGAIGFLLLLSTNLIVGAGSVARAGLLARYRVQDTLEKHMPKLDSAAHLLFIWQHSNGYECWIARYQLMPHLVDCGVFSLGKPASGTDVWTTPLKSEEFERLLIKSDYLFIGKEGGSLWSDYGAFFDAPNIGLFQVNKSTHPRLTFVKK